jgi:parallel beta-helix repeat protein
MWVGLLPFFNLSLGGQEITTISTAWVTAGETVTLTGSGFTGNVANLRVIDQLATIQSASDTEITFTMPLDFESGRLELLDASGQATVSLYSLRPAVEISGQLNLPAGVDQSAYIVAYDIDPITPNPDGSFVLESGLGRVSFVYALNIIDPDGPFFAALLTGGTDAITIDARSTAKVFAMANIDLATQSSAVATLRDLILEELPATDIAAAIIEAVSAPQVDYLVDARLDPALAEMISTVPLVEDVIVDRFLSEGGSQALNSRRASRSNLAARNADKEKSKGTAEIIGNALYAVYNSVTTNGSNIIEAASVIYNNGIPTTILPFDITFSGGEAIDLNQEFPIDSFLPPIGRLALDGISGKKDTPSEGSVFLIMKPRYPAFQGTAWYLDMYEIDASNYANISEVRSLSDLIVPERTGDGKPIAKGFVRADNVGQFVDSIEVLSKYVVSKTWGRAQENSIDPDGDGFTVRGKPIDFNDSGFSVELDKGRPGLYMINAYSGNVHYGLGLQADLIKQIDENNLWTWALGGNMIPLAIDLAAMAFPIDDDSKSYLSALSRVPVSKVKQVNAENFNNLLGIFRTVSENIGKSLAISATGGSGNGQGSDLNSSSLDAVAELLQSSVQPLVGFIVDLAIDRAAKIRGKGSEAYTEAVAKGVGKILNASARISSGAQAAQRLTGLISTNTRAVERYVVVIGNPFDARIEAVVPKQVIPGNAILIIGDQFSKEDDSSRVEKVEVGTDNGSGEFIRASDLVDLQVNGRHILGSLPSDLDTSKSELHFRVVIDGVEGGVSTVGDPRSLSIKLLPVPELTLSSPTMVSDQSTVSVGLNSENFTPEMLQFKVANSFGFEQDLKILSINRDKAVLDLEGFRVQAANQLSFSVQMKVYAYDPNEGLVISQLIPSTSPAVMATVEPVIGDPSSKAFDLTIDAISNAIADDGILTSMEAFLIASVGIESTYGGTIQGPRECELVFNPECDDIPLFRDVDSMVEFTLGSDPSKAFDIISVPSDKQVPYRIGGGGHEVRNRVRLSSELANQIEAGTALTWTPDRALPPFESGDVFELFGLIIDGSNTGSNSAAADFSEVSNGSLKDVTFINFAGDGLVLTGTASDPANSNVFERVKFTNNGGRGVVFGGHAQRNSFNGVVDGATGDALRLDGEAVQDNQFVILGGFLIPTEPNSFVNSTSGHGIHILNGASNNRIELSSASGNALNGIHIEGVDTSNNSIFGGDASENTGNGIYLGAGARDNLLRFQSALNNSGDGVRVEGAGNSFNILEALKSSGNEGNGVTILGGATRVRLGDNETYRVAPGSITTVPGDDRNFISNNMGHGIHIEGPASGENEIYMSSIGPGNTGHNILINAGSSKNIIGSIFTRQLYTSGSPSGFPKTYLGPLLGNEITQATNGAGIRLDNAHGNLILGNTFQDNLVGIHLLNGSSGNQIGGAHDRAIEVTHEFEYQQNSFTTHTLENFLRPSNLFGRHTDACIWLEDAGVLPDLADTTRKPNKFFGNSIGETTLGFRASDIGIKITGASYGNVFGGIDPDLGNRIFGTNKAGILFDTYTLPDPQLRNLFRNNLIELSGQSFREFGFEYGAAQGWEPVFGHGVVFHDSTGVIFGEEIHNANLIDRCSFGIYSDRSDNVTIRGTRFDGNRDSAIVIYNGQGAKIGDSEAIYSNTFTSNGDSDQEIEGAIQVYFTHNVSIKGNLFGSLKEDEVGMPTGNRGPSVYLNGAVNTMIGGISKNEGNTIVQNEGPGIYIENFSRTTHVGNNRIGTVDEHVLSSDHDYLGNNGDGVIIKNNASSNVVGGTLPDTVNGQIVEVPTGNIITRSSGNGILVEGSGSINNDLRNNRIEGNSGRAVLLSGGANGSSTLPQNIEFDGKALSGPVASATPGSIIQAFAYGDYPLAEGNSLLSQATVYEDGSWEVAGLDFLNQSNLSYAVTSTSGSTSEFFKFAFNAAYRIVESDAEANNAIGNRSSLQVVHRFDIGAVDVPVRFDTLTFTDAGSFDLNTLLGVYLYWDSNADGALSSADILLSGPADFEANTVTFQLTTAPIIQPGEIQKWLVAYAFDSSNPLAVGDTIAISIANSSNVSAIGTSGAFAVGPTVDTSFPIESTNCTIVESGYSIWVSSEFAPNASLTEPTSDPDKDGRVNLVEYLEKTDPTQPDQGAGRSVVIEDGILIVRQPRGIDRTDVSVTPRIIFDLTDPNLDGNLFGPPTLEAGDGGSEVLVFRSLININSFDALFTQNVIEFK